MEGTACLVALDLLADADFSVVFVLALSCAKAIGLKQKTLSKASTVKICVFMRAF